MRSFRHHFNTINQTINMAKLKNLAEVAPSNLPATIGQHLATRTAILERMARIDEAKKKLKEQEDLCKDALKSNTDLFLTLHKEHGDFELGGVTAKAGGGYSTIVVDESKLPDECFNKVVSLTKVKELVIAGVIPKSVAYQQKNSTVTVK